MPGVVILYNINYHVEFVSWRGPRLSVDHSTGPQGRALSLPPDRKQVVSETKEANAQITLFFQSSPLIILIIEIYKALTPLLQALNKDKNYNTHIYPQFTKSTQVMYTSTRVHA